MFEPKDVGHPCFVLSYRILFSWCNSYSELFPRGPAIESSSDEGRTASTSSSSSPPPSSFLFLLLGVLLAVVSPFVVVVVVVVVRSCSTSPSNATQLALELRPQFREAGRSTRISYAFQVQHAPAARHDASVERPKQCWRRLLLSPSACCPRRFRLQRTASSASVSSRGSGNRTR